MLSPSEPEAGEEVDAYDGVGGDYTLIASSSSFVEHSDGNIRSLTLEDVRVFHPGGAPAYESSEVVATMGVGAVSKTDIGPNVVGGQPDLPSGESYMPALLEQESEDKRQDMGDNILPPMSPIQCGQGSPVVPSSGANSCGLEPEAGMASVPGQAAVAVVPPPSDGGAAGGLSESGVPNASREEEEVWQEEQGRMVWFRRTPGLDPTLYLSGVAGVIGKANIAYINTSDRTQIQVYTRRSAFVQRLLDVGIHIGAAWYKAYRGAEKPLKIVVEGVPPCIPNGTIAAALGSIGVCAPGDVETLPFTSKDPALQHVKSCKRVGWVRAVGEVVVPDSITYTFAGREFHSDIHTGQPKCFRCTAVGHVRRDCPLGRVVRGSGRPLTMAEVVAGGAGASEPHPRPKAQASRTGLGPKSLGKVGKSDGEVTPQEIAHMAEIQSWMGGAQEEGGKVTVGNLQGDSKGDESPGDKAKGGEVRAPGEISPASGRPVEPPVGSQVVGRKAQFPAGMGQNESPYVRGIRFLVDELGVKGVTKGAGGVILAGRASSFAGSESDSGGGGWSAPIKVRRSKVSNKTGPSIGGRGLTSGGGAGKGKGLAQLGAPPGSEDQDAPLLKKKGVSSKVGSAVRLARGSNALQMVSLTEAYNEAIKACGGTGPFVVHAKGSFPHVTATRLGKEEARYIAASPQYPRLAEFINFLAESAGASPMDESGGSRKRRVASVDDSPVAVGEGTAGKVGRGPPLPQRALNFAGEVRDSAARHRARRRGDPPPQS